MYAAPIWARATTNGSYMQDGDSVQRLCALRVCCTFRTVSHDAALVISGGIPIDLLAVESANIRAGSTGVATDSQNRNNYNTNKSHNRNQGRQYNPQYNSHNQWYTNKAQQNKPEPMEVDESLQIQNSQNTIRVKTVIATTTITRINGIKIKSRRHKQLRKIIRRTKETHRYS